MLRSKCSLGEDRYNITQWLEFVTLSAHIRKMTGNFCWHDLFLLWLFKKYKTRRSGIKAGYGWAANGIPLETSNTNVHIPSALRVFLGRTPSQHYTILVRTPRPETPETQTGETAEFHTVLTQGQEWGRPPGHVEGEALAGNLIWASSARLGPSVFSWESFWTPPPSSRTGLHRWCTWKVFLPRCASESPGHVTAIWVPPSEILIQWVLGDVWESVFLKSSLSDRDVRQGVKPLL